MRNKKSSEYLLTRYVNFYVKKRLALIDKNTRKLLEKYLIRTLTFSKLVYGKEEIEYIRMNFLTKVP